MIVPRPIAPHNESYFINKTKLLPPLFVLYSVQMAASRLINLQHHRIAQCQSIQITILGDEGNILYNFIFFLLLVG